MPDYAQRIGDLKRLRAAFKARLDEFVAAMSADFGRRSRHESLLSDGMTVLNEIDHLLRHLRGWMRPKRPPPTGCSSPARTEVRYQPLGVVGIIAPWNYPVNLSLDAAGGGDRGRQSRHAQAVRAHAAHVGVAEASCSTTCFPTTASPPCSAVRTWPVRSPRCRSIICSSPARPRSGARSWRRRRRTSRR